MRSNTPRTLVSWFGLVLWLAGCQSKSTPDTEGAQAALVAVCADSSLSESDSWTCPEPITVECSDQADLPLPVASPEGVTCDPNDLRISDAGPYTPGTHDVTVQNAGGQTLCTTEVTVTDTQAPVVESHVVQLWPPNHKFHDIAIEDCVTVTDGCESDLQGEFLWASSDEPVDDKGDGHHAPDILLGEDCQHVSVRSERQGPKDGRVYKLGVRVTDSSGNATDAVCTVIVDHDQRGVVGADSGEAYRITFDGKDGGPTCDGQPDMPPTTPPTNPPPGNPPQPEEPGTPDNGPE